ncbi:MAG: dockerin type I domain-containing protein [Planctomycetota bacterium]
MKSKAHSYAGRIVMVAAVAILGTVAAFGQSPLDPNVFTTNGNGEVVRMGGLDLPPSPQRTTVEWGTPSLLASYLNFDYWSLRTRGVRDTVGNLHFAVELYEYSNPTSNMDRFVLSPAGELLETHLNWSGVGGRAVVNDANGRNVYLRPVATASEHGCVDSANYIHLFQGGGDIQYAKLDPDGNIVINWTTITSGAGSWGGYVQPVVTGTDMLVATWYRSTEDICAVMSTDGGVTWSDIVVLVDRPANEQTTMLKTCVAADDYVHLVYRSWNFDNNQERVYYTKLCPDWSTVCVGETIFRTSSTWYPFVSLDDAGDLHVSFGPLYQTGTTLVYTCLRGDLDLGGAPATDEMLTIVPDQTFVSDPDKVRYAVNLPDGDGAVHVIYEEGDYGRGTDKDAFYVASWGLGDMNCDGNINSYDIDGFICALSPQCDYEGLYPDCYRTLADCNGDGDVNSYDIDTFIALVGGG